MEITAFNSLWINFEDFRTAPGGNVQVLICIDCHTVRDKSRIFTIFLEIDENTFIGWNGKEDCNPLSSQNNLRNSTLKSNKRAVDFHMKPHGKTLVVDQRKNHSIFLRFQSSVSCGKSYAHIPYVVSMHVKKNTATTEKSEKFFCFIIPPQIYPDLSV